MPQSENNMNKIDRLFRDPLKASEVKPPSAIWNNIERGILLKERKKEKRKIVLLRWSVAASIAMLFSLGAYMLVIDTENKELKQEAALSNKVIVSSSPKSNSVQPELSDIKQPDTQKTNSKTDKLIVENTDNVPVNKTIVDSDYQVRDQESAPALSKSVQQVSAPSGKDPSSPKGTPSEFGEAVKNPDKNNSIDQVAVVISKNVPELPIQPQPKPDTIININATTSLTADHNEAKIPIDSLPISFTQSKELISDTAFSSDTFASNDPNKINTQTNYKWWVGAFYSPDYTYQKFSIASDNSQAAYSGNSNAADIKNLYADASHPKYSYTTGLQAGYRINNKWSVQAGFLYADKGEKTNYKLVVTPSPSPTTTFSNISMTTTIQDNTLVTNEISVDQNYTVNYKYRYFDVPLLIKYHVGNSRLNYCISAGFSANLFFKYQTVTKSIDSGEKKVTRENSAPFKSINYSAIASIGMNYSFSKRISMSLEPTFRYALTSTVNNCRINTYPYSLGLMTGIKYHF